MDDLNSYKERLEANLNVLNKFEGLETDLIQQHGNLRAQFGEYREAIENSSGISEQEKKEHFNHHDELIKKLHKLVLVAKGLARKRTEQMTRDELFRMSQERQKSLKSQSSEDKIGEEVTKSLKRMLETMRSEVERSSSNISTATSTTKNLKSTTDNYEKLSGTIDESRGLIRDLWKRNRNDMIYIFGALGIFVATVSYVIVQRSPGVMWLPGKMVARQLSNLSRYSSYMIPKSREIVEMITEMTEAALSDTEEYDEPPRMFIDSIKKMEEEYGSDELLKEAEGEVSGSIEQENVDERVSESEKAANVKSEDPVIEAKGPENQFGNPETVEESVLEEIVAEPSIEVDATKVAEESIHSETTDVPVEESVITETVESFETVSVESIEAGISTSETLPLVTTTEPTIEINPEVPTEVTEPIQSTENADFIATSTEIPSDPEIVNIIEKTENEAIIIPPTVVTTVEEPSLIVTPFESTFIPIPTPAIHDTLSYYSASATDTETSKDYSSEAELFSLEL